MNDCIPDTSYFATPEFLSLVLHCMSVIEVPFHLFGAWIILSHTPSTMSSLKWPLLNLHFWSSFMDISISLLTTPYVLFPEIAGFPLGLLSKIGFSAVFQVHFVVTVIGLVTVSILTVYSNRYYIMLGSNVSPLRKCLRLSLFLGCYVVTSTFMIPFTSMIPNQQEAVRTVFERLPCLPKYVYNSPVFVYTLDFTSVILTILSLFCLAAFFIFLFIGLTLFHLLKETRAVKFSQKTLSLQKKFLAGLIIQTSIPIIVGIGPASYMGVVVPQGYYNQALNNFSFIAISFHGLISTAAMLLIYHSYRQATMSILFPCWYSGSIRNMGISTVFIRKVDVL